MKKFIIRLLIFIGLPVSICFLAFFRLDGYTDPYYLRFTTAEQTSLITGTSRAAQAMQPQFFNEILHRDDMYNYSFTIAHSSYGPTYLESIKKKIKKTSKNGMFIVTIDPWSISSNLDDPNDSSRFPELKLALGRTKIVDMNPNIFYLINSYEKPYINLFKSSRNSGLFLHRNGWLELTIPMDSISVAKRLEQKIVDYKTVNLHSYKFSNIRFSYLLKTIYFLQNHGKVYLVRLPIHDKIQEIENLFMPDFDDKIRTLTESTQTKYMSLKDFTGDYQFVDGNHLFKLSGAQVSIEIANWITHLQNK